MRKILTTVGIVVVLGGILLQLRAATDDEAGPSAATRVLPKVPAIRAAELRQRPLYASPQDPGYTSWVGAWAMPDGSLMTGFTQATGPVEPSRRQLVPKRVLRAFGAESWKPSTTDFWGLDLTVEYLRSRNQGRSWQPFRSERFQALRPHPYSSQATLALQDGTIVRRVNGDDLRDDADLPHTAFLQRLAPGARRWSAPQVLLDPARFTYQITRLRLLRDGRLIATGNVWDAPAATRQARRDVPSRELLMVSSDQGRTWRNGLTVRPGAGYLSGNEWDTAELPDGNLLGVMRSRVSDAPDAPEVRRQAILVKRGAGWVISKVQSSPLEPSGHPELLATREGPILHLATTGIDYTRDGRTWERLAFPRNVLYRTPYYPRALQTPDGRVHVIGHVGGDDEYGERDQSIQMDSFRVRIDNSR